MIDAVVVLGAAMAAAGVPGPALRRRLEYGVTMFFDRHAGYLLVSGGIVGPPPAEARAMREMALSRGVAPTPRGMIETLCTVTRVRPHCRWTDGLVASPV